MFHWPILKSTPSPRQRWCDLVYLRNPSDVNWTRTQNHLDRKRTLNHVASLAKWLSVRLRTKWFWLRVQLQSQAFYKCLRISFFTEHLRWLVLERVCEGTSLLKVLQSYHFNIFEINHKCFRKMRIKKNNE